MTRAAVTKLTIHGLVKIRFDVLAQLRLCDLDGDHSCSHVPFIVAVRIIA